MKQEAKGKIFIGMIVSIVAFGFATGTGFIIGSNPLNSTGLLNLTQQSQFPTIPASHTNTTNTIKSTNQVNNSQSSQPSTVTPSNPNTSGNSTDTPTNSSKNNNGT